MINGVNIGLGITGSFCTFDKIILVLQDLVKQGANVIPIMSYNATKTDTRFGNAEDFRTKIKELTGNDIVDTIVAAEPLGPNNKIDVMVIAPCTPNKND